MLEKISHQHELRTWAGLKAAKALTLVLLPAYVLSMYRNLIVELNLVTAAYYTALMLFLAAMGWFQKVRPNLRLAAVSMVILLIALGVLFRNQDLGFAQTFGVLGAAVLPLYFNRRIAPYLSMLPILGLGGLAFLVTDAPTLIIIIITSGSLAVVYVVTSTFCYVIEHTEKQRDIAEHALNTSLEKERLLDLSYTVMDLAVAELDVQSDRVRLIAGHSPNKALIEQGVSFWDFYNSVYGEGAAQKIRDLFNTPGKSLVLHANVNGEPDHWAKVGCSAEYMRDGRRYRSIYRLIVDELVGARNEAELKARELVKQQDRQAQMYAVIGHELRTPAASMQMMLEGLEEGQGLDNKLLGANIEQLLSVIDTLRAVAQPERMAKAAFVDVQLDEMLQLQVQNFQPMAQRQGVKLRTNLAELTVHPVHIQKTLLRQVVSNLIKNAMIHSEGSEILVGAKGQVIDSDHKRVKIWIEDNGKGVPADKVDALFEAFVRGSTEAEGTGLGLYVCREIIQNMGGELRYEPNPVGGSRFVVELDARLADSAAPADKEQPHATALEGMRILLAEDNKTIQMLTQKMLTKQGAQVEVCNNGAEALAAYESGSVDLVLSDIFMPVMNGYQFVAALREQGYEGQVIGLTAATIGEETDKMLAAGANAVLSKPVNIKELTKLVASFKS